MATSDIRGITQAGLGWQTWAGLAVSRAPQIQAGTWTANWTPGPLPAGGFLDLQYTNLTSPSGTSLIRVTISEAATGKQAPLWYMSGGQLGITGWQTNSTAAGSIQAAELAQLLFTGYYALISSFCAATLRSSAQASTPRPGGTKDVLSVLTAISTTDADQWPIVIAVTDISQQVNAANLSSHLTPIIGSPTNIILFDSSLKENEALIPDVDVSINNGSAIYSVMSQTFAFPEE